MRDNFMIGARVAVLDKIAHDEQSDMIAPRDTFVEVNAEEPRSCAEPDVSFLGKLSHKRREKRLAGLDTAAGKMPSVNIRVFDKEDPSRTVDHHGAGAQRRRSREAPIEMHNPAHDRLKHASQTIQVLHHHCLVRPVENRNSLFRMIPIHVINAPRTTTR